MAVTEFQRTILNLIAGNRIAGGESYVAGGVASILGRQWHMILKEAEKIIELLPPEEIGNCILDDKAKLFIGGPEVLEDALKRDALQFHKGSIKGAWPKIR